MNNSKKITKKSQYIAILDILSQAKDAGFALPEEMDYESLVDFINHEVELLDNKAAAAAKRAADKKVAGDELRAKIYNVLSDTEFKTIAEIEAALGDPDVSAQMITARLKQLKETEQVEKDSVTVPPTTEGGKSRKVTAYRKFMA